MIARAFASSLGAVILLGIIGGYLAASRVLARVDAMTETTRAIMAGDLDGRLAVSGAGDELDRLATNLNRMLERIGELMRGMRDVSDNIAHDLKTPLTRLRNRADEALRGAKSEDELRAALDAVIEEGDGLIRIFNALLMIARLEAGSASEIMAPIDLGATARGVSELYEALAEDEGFTVAIDAEEGVIIEANRELIGQALANLLDNALKYGKSAEGAPGRIAITVRRGDGVARLDVADGGLGIPPEARDRVLGRFVRLEESRSAPGFGLGLSLVNAVMRLHRGRLTLADNEPACGCRWRSPRLRSFRAERGHPPAISTAREATAESTVSHDAAAPSCGPRRAATVMVQAWPPGSRQSADDVTRHAFRPAARRVQGVGPRCTLVCGAIRNAPGFDPPPCLRLPCH